ncbi:L-threonine 3-dehydrogenase [Thalictrum thalictroides]|uniref:L-threonine 3-dehydrogenase n=1 Tax=Thalictrum thalictroides TaxID=46969 RepID=A0A7J6V9V3_THATH|nr:L-threonine 3-dehydrogenase [Thalictrum thalictroides]
MGKGGISNDGENMAAWLLGVNHLKVQPFKLPALGPNDVKINIKAVGICGSDVHYLKHGRCGDYAVTEPMVIGHECAGIVAEVGSEVKSVVVGDRVALEPGIGCWHCSQCKGEEGAMCEPLSVGIHACRRANVGAATTVLIVVAGPIGLVTLLAARAFGAPKVVIADVDSHRLSVAKKLGADAIIQVSTRSEDVGNEVEQIQKAMGVGVDVTFDCVGFSKTMTTALNATTSGGKVCLVGMGHNEMSVPLTPAAAREVDIVGIFRYKNTWPICLELLSSGKIDVKPLITHRFGFSQSEVEEAFETSARGSDAIKVMFNL